MIGGMRPGTIVAVEVRRGSEMLTLKVKLAPGRQTSRPGRRFRRRRDRRPETGLSSSSKFQVALCLRGTSS